MGTFVQKIWTKLPKAPPPARPLSPASPPISPSPPLPPPLSPPLFPSLSPSPLLLPHPSICSWTLQYCTQLLSLLIMFLFPSKTDEQNTALGLVFSSKESIIEATKTKRGVYYSRSRGLWRKGESSGNVQVSTDMAQVAQENSSIYLITKMRLGGRCLVRESPSTAEGPRW